MTLPHQLEIIDIPTGSLSANYVLSVSCNFGVTRDLKNLGRENRHGTIIYVKRTVTRLMNGLNKP